MIKKIINGDFLSFHILLCTGILGISAITTQLVLIREILSAFSGNEICVGITLGNWLLLSGIGAYLGKLIKNSQTSLRILPFLHILTAVIPFLEIGAIRVLKNLVFMHGAATGITETVVSCFMVLLPFCLTSGFYLVLACQALSGSRSVGKVYISDSIGSIIGGIVFSFILIQFMNHIQLVTLLAILNLVCAILFGIQLRWFLFSIISSLLAIGCVFLNLRYDFDFLFTKKQFPGQQILHNANSPYGRIVVTKTENQVNFIENGVPLSPSHNIQHAEETIHFAMAQKPDATNVLLLSGGYAGTTKEILKYKNAKIDYVELDPLIIKFANEFVRDNLSHPKINIINTDSRRFIRETTNFYDVVIIDLPDPINSQINRLLTKEFFQEINRILSKGGVVSFGISRYENYVSDELAKILSTVNHTLARAFPNVLIIPASRVFFIASNLRLTTDIAEILEKYDIKTHYVRRSYINAIMSPDRMADIQKGALRFKYINRDLKPVLYYFNLTHWMSQFRIKLGIMEGIFVFALIFYAFKLNPTQMAIFSSGFTGSSLEIALLIVFQSLFGSLYSRVAVIVTCFMFGLALGALIAQRVLRGYNGSEHDLRQMKHFLGFSAFGLGIFSLAIYFMLVLLSELSCKIPLIAQSGIYGITIILSVIAGFQFPIASAVESGTVVESAGKIYGADFIGAAIGALLAGTLLIPALGIGTTCLIAFALNFLSFWLISNEIKKIYILDGGLAG